MNTPKPDQYMPFDGRAFFEATAGMSDSFGNKYLRAIWHYWSHNGCKGLRNDEEYLRSICHCDHDEWPKLKQMIFDSGEYFHKENGLWQQKRAREIWNKQVELMKANQAKTEAARKARWGK